MQATNAFANRKRPNLIGRSTNLYVSHAKKNASAITKSAFKVRKPLEFEQLRKDQQRPVPKIKWIAYDTNVEGRTMGQHDAI